MKLYLQILIKSSHKEVAIRCFLLFSYPSFTFRSAANKGFGKVGFENKPSAFVILLSFCTLAVLNQKIRPRPGRGNSISQPSQSPGRCALFSETAIQTCTLKTTLSLLYFCLTMYANTAAGQIIENKNINDFDSLLLSKECNLDKEELGKIFTKLEIYAEFPGGIQKWFDFAKANFDFMYVVEQLGDTVQYFEDSIIVKFIVARNGTICNINFKKGNPILTDPTIKLLKYSPNWRPGVHGGRLLNSYRTLKLNILIDKKENKKTIKVITSAYFMNNS